MEEGVVVLLKMVWYFEDGGLVLCRGWCGTLKRVVHTCGILKILEGGVLPRRSCWSDAIIKVEFNPDFMYLFNPDFIYMDSVMSRRPTPFHAGV